MTPDTFALAALIAAGPAAGLGVVAAVTAPDPDRALIGAAGLGVVAWVILGLYMTIVLAT